MSNCYICNAELADYEEDKLDCGHYACNSCTYSKRIGEGRNIHQCSNCFEHIEMTDLDATEKGEEKK